ncbi:MAG: hypothetical protein ACXQTR_00855 [Candidatus Methanospirareceae archaeon]
MTYLQKGMTRIKIDRLMTAAWNFKNIHLALHPDHINTSWVIELEKTMNSVDELFPPEENREWRK